MLAQELRKARIAAGLTQEQLAGRARLSREYVNYVERGKRQPTVRAFIQLCKGLKVHPPEMLERIMRHGTR